MQSNYLFQVSLGNVLLGLAAGVGVEGAEDFHCLIVAWLSLEDNLEARGCLLYVPTVDIHLPEPVLGQDEVWRRKLSGLIIILEGLVVVALNVIGTSHLVARLRPHCLVFRVVKSVQRQVLHLGVILRARDRLSTEFEEPKCESYNLFEEKMIGQVIKHHGVRRVNSVGT